MGIAEVAPAARLLPILHIIGVIDLAKIKILYRFKSTLRQFDAILRQNGTPASDEIYHGPRSYQDMHNCTAKS